MSKFLKRFAVFLLVAATIGACLMIFGGKTTAYQFKESTETLKNPLIGFAPSADYEDAAADNTLVYVDITWRELEPSEGVYAFAAIEEENYLARWKSEGKHVVLRFVCDIPGDQPHRDIPDWLYDKISGDGKNYDISYGKGFSPNYSNPVFIAAHKKAIEAMGGHFGKDGFVSYIELGSLGHWGEWHVMYEAGIPRIPSELVRRQYIEPYVTAFPNTKIMMRRPFHIAKTNNFGLFNDMAGDKAATDEWLDWIRNGGDYSQAEEENALSPMPDVWKTAPIGGEFTSSHSFAWMLKDNLAQTIQLIRNSHTTFLGPKCPHGFSESGGAGLKAQASEVLKNMGYRLRVQNATVSKTFLKDKMTVSLAFINEGVAPLYFDWPTYLYLLTSSNQVIKKYPVDIKLSKLTGKTVLKTKNMIELKQLPKGSYKLCIGIEDPMTNVPAVSFAMAAPRINTLSVLYSGIL